MSTHPQSAPPSAGSKTDPLPSEDKKPRTRGRLLAGLGVILVAAVAFAGYALAYPERMPDVVGEYVEDLTGANPHPVQLMLPPTAPLSVVAKLGKQIFYDTSLSASGKQSCASCHSAAHAYGPANNLDVQLGGPNLDRQGYRPPPSLTYLYRQTPLTPQPRRISTRSPRPRRIRNAPTRSPVRRPPPRPWCPRADSSGTAARIRINARPSVR
jgi:cytochrome c peroxidase